MKLCAASTNPPCPALATHGDLCVAHAANATRVPHAKNTKPVICARCQLQIHPSHWQKHISAGRVEHGGYLCEPSDRPVVDVYTDGIGVTRCSICFKRPPCEHVLTEPSA